MRWGEEVINLHYIYLVPLLIALGSLFFSVPSCVFSVRPLHLVSPFYISYSTFIFFSSVVFHSFLVVSFLSSLFLFISILFRSILFLFSLSPQILLSYFLSLDLHHRLLSPVVFTSSFLLFSFLSVLNSLIFFFLHAPPLPIHPFPYSASLPPSLILTTCQFLPLFSFLSPISCPLLPSPPSPLSSYLLRLPLLPFSSSSSPMHLPPYCLRLYVLVGKLCYFRVV